MRSSEILPFGTMKSLIGDRRGNVVVIFALACIPALVGIGAAVLVAAQTPGGIAAQTDVLNTMFTLNMSVDPLADATSGPTPSLTANADVSSIPTVVRYD